MKRKKVLVICSQEIIEEQNDGGKKCSFRNYELFNSIFGNENVFLCLLTNNKAEDLQNIFRLSAYKSTMERIINVLQGRLFTNSENEKKIIKFIINNQIDIVIFERSIYGSLINRIKKSELQCKIWVFVHNVERDYFKNKVKNQSIFYYIPYLKVAESEKKTFKYADFIMTLTGRDSKLIKNIYGKNSNLILPMTFRDTYDEKKVISNGFTRKNLLFVGTMFQPNYKGIKWFVENVMEELRDYHLTIVGKNFEKKREELERSNVEVVGTTDSLEQYYYADNIMVIPIFYGDGMKIKTAEAMMYGKIILASDEALEGYQVENIDGIYRCNTKENYINCIRKLEKENNERLKKNVRQLFLNNYSFDSMLEKYKQYILKQV